MSDNPITITRDDGPRSGEYAMLLYDYSKHLLSLALISIGGVLTLAQSTVGQGIPTKSVGIIVLILAGSGVSALSCTAAVLRSRERGTALTNLASYLHQASMGLLGMGFGTFLANWLSVLAKWLLATRCGFALTQIK